MIKTNYFGMQWLMLTFLFVCLFRFGIYPGWNQTKSDFPNYFVSTQLLLNGNLQDAYSVENFNQAIQELVPNTKGLFVMYPPSTALVMLPLSALDILAAKRIWLLISLLFFVDLLRIMQGRLKLKMLHTALITLFAGFNLFNDLMLGQIYVAMLWLLLKGYDYYQKESWISAGILWAIVASLKFIPLLFLLLFFFLKQYRMLFALLISFLVIQLITLALTGIQTYQAFFDAFTTNYLNGKVANELPTSIQYQSFESIVNSYFPPGGKDVIRLVLLMSWKMFWLGLTLATLLRFRLHKEMPELAISSLLLLLLLVEAGSATYHLLFLFVPLLFMMKHFHPKAKMLALSTWAMLGFLPTILSKFNSSFFLLGYARLELLVLFAIIFYASSFRTLSRSSLGTH